MVSWFVDNWRGVNWWLALVALPQVLTAVHFGAISWLWLLPMISWFFIAGVFFWWLK